jgi:stalled ribosome rescue protein Dom34
MKDFGVTVITCTPSYFLHLIDKAEGMRATVVVLSSEFEPGERLAALGGIAALLRYRMS